MNCIAVTGATGFLGRRTVEWLLDVGREVVACGRNEAIGSELAAAGARFLPCDLAEKEKLKAAFSGCGAVVHCAALSSPWGRRRAFFAANAEGTRNVVEACIASGVARLIYISTPSVYMRRCDQFGLVEANPLPRSLFNDYVRSKHLGELHVKDGFSRGLETITLRPQGIFGPRDAAILPRLLAIAKRGTLPSFRGGGQMIDLTYVDNAAGAIVAAVEAPQNCAGRIYNITNGEPVAQFAVIQKILDRLGLEVRVKAMPLAPVWGIACGIELFHKICRPDVEPVLTRHTICSLAYSRTLSIEAARRDLGYAPLVSMSEGIERMVEWCRLNAAT